MMDKKEIKKPSLNDLIIKASAFSVPVKDVNIVSTVFVIFDSSENEYYVEKYDEKLCAFEYVSHNHKHVKRFNSKEEIYELMRKQKLSVFNNRLLTIEEYLTSNINI